LGRIKPRPNGCQSGALTSRPRYPQSRITNDDRICQIFASSFMLLLIDYSICMVFLDMHAVIIVIITGLALSL
jgi:hypothetical protein